jgi:signal transduction histidine kinase/CheY-like chemotaxis protein
VDSAATQRIVKIRRDYNAWVANETLEDYALRFAPRSFRRWSFRWIANTALGAVSFLALESIGATLMLNWGFANAALALLVVTVVILATGLPISYYAARYAVDMDLLTRGAGFGYIGSTITSLIYASFTFIFFAIEAAIMALALELLFGIPLIWGYLVSSLAIIPIVIHGITWISRLQAWTQPFWLVLQILPFAFIAWRMPDTYGDALGFRGYHDDGIGLLAIGAATTVAFSLIAQIGEQVDYLRFLPPASPANRRRWWAAVLAAGPGWILPGVTKMFGGAFLAFLAMQHMIPPDRAVEPTQMYLVVFQQALGDPRAAVLITGLFVILCQVKINATNAYAGSLAWSNFFSRLTHSHPGRVVWLVFNVTIAFALMMLGVLDALEHVLGIYSNIAVAWIGAVVADLVVNKPLGLSPAGIEFRRAYLHHINPVGVGAMLAGSLLAMVAYGGHLGEVAQAFSPPIALATAFVLAPAIALATRGRYYLARTPTTRWRPGESVECVVCANAFESEDMAACPAYGGAICSLCCTLDARCADRCKPRDAALHALGRRVMTWFPDFVPDSYVRRIGLFAGILTIALMMIGAILALVYQQETIAARTGQADLGDAFLRIYAVLALISAIAVWWMVLTHESRKVAQLETERQTELLMREIDAHEATDALLQKAKDVADAANAAKSRYVRGISHELRTPLNTILGYAQILQRAPELARGRREAIATIQRSGEHLLALIDGLLDIARIEAGRLTIERRELRLADLLEHIENVFRLEAGRKGLGFRMDVDGALPDVVLGDESRLRQILINLLGNAIRFTGQGEVTLRVSHRAEIAVFAVIDTGCGIPAEDFERIFLPFERSRSRGGPEPGTGLGLSIAQLLAELMGGQITVRSTVGTGSTFTVKLYLPRVARPAIANRPEGEIDGYLGPRRALLIVDDHASQRRLLVDLLEPKGFVIDQAANGPEAIAAAIAGGHDAVLLDVEMAGMDGWRACALLRDAGYPGAVVMVSATAHDDSPQRRKAAGCDDFVLKPVLESTLCAVLQQHLGITWTFTPKHIDPSPASSSKPPTELPPTTTAGLPLTEETVSLPAAAAERLASLARLGHLRGIQRSIDDLEAEGGLPPAAIAWLRRLAHELRFDDLAALASENDDDARPGQA